MSDRLRVGDLNWDRKLKRKIDESCLTDKDSSNLSLSLSLGGGGGGSGSGIINNNMMLMLSGSSSNATFKSLKGHHHHHEGSLFAPRQSSNDNNKEEVMMMMKPNDNKEMQQFSCKFCDKKFPNPQALGGHQNAHKLERILSRMDKEFSMRPFGLGVALPVAAVFLYSPMPMPNHHYPFNASSLLQPLYYGAHHHHMNAMFHYHMSAVMPSLCFGLGYGNHQMGHQFGMMSNSSSWGNNGISSVETTTTTPTPKRLNRMVGVGIGGHELDQQVPSLAGGGVNVSATAAAAHAGSQDFLSPKPNLSLSL